MTATDLASAISRTVTNACGHCIVPPMTNLFPRIPPSFFRSPFEKVRRAKSDPDLSEKLSNGLVYLNADEMEEVQQALAMSIYAHSLNSKHGRGRYGAVEVRACVRACLLLHDVSGIRPANNGG